MTSKEKREFWGYHNRNPQIYKAFEEKALKATQLKQRFGARAIFEVLRWETAVRGDGQWKINNTYTPFYARLFECYHPEHKGFFQLRELKETFE